MTEARAWPTWTTVAKSAPPAADVRLRLAGFYERWDRLTDAVAQYDLWINAHPDDNRHSLALNGRCWARGLLGQDLDKALSDCDAAHGFNRRTAASSTAAGWFTCGGASSTRRSPTMTRPWRSSRRAAGRSMDADCRS